MSRVNRLRAALLAACASAWLTPCPVTAQDADTREVQSYVLTDAGLAKYTQASRKIAALSGAASGSCEDDDSESTSLRDVTAKLDALPGIKSAIQSTGMTTREYVVFSFSLLHNGLAAWSASQPGGRLPPGATKANVDFYNKHKSELEKLEALRKDDACTEEAEDGEETEE